MTRLQRSEQGLYRESVLATGKRGRPAGAIRSRAAALAQRSGFWVALVLAVSLLTRWLFMSVPINIDEGMWIRRGPLFVIALLHGDWPGTYLRHHPGVTNMWVSGAALSLRYALRGLLPAGDAARQGLDLAHYLSSVATASPGAPLWAYVTVRAAAAVLTSGCVAGIFVLSRRLFGQPVALLMAALLLLEPFYLAYQRSITTDANQANFTWLALLSFLLYGRAALQGRRSWGWLIFSGVCYGLAGLSKVSALLSLPVFALWALWVMASRPQSTTRLRLAGQLAAWAAVAGLTVLALWPALWTNLPGTLARMTTDVGGEIEGHYQFFLGQATLAPGPGYYPLVMIFRLSPLLALGSLWGCATLLWPRLRGCLPDRPALWIVLADVLVVLLGLSSQASKLDRYIIPVVPGLALLAANGLWAAWLAWQDRRQVSAAATVRLRLGLGTVLLGRLVMLLLYYPVLLNYFSPLAGGPAGAQQAFMIGNGELLNRAAAWLNAQPGAANATTASWYSGSFAPYYLGQTVELIQDPATQTWPLADARYAVLYVNQFQRLQPPEVVNYFANQRPLYTVSAHGVDYARVYAGPAMAGNAPGPGAQPAALEFGSYARLIGYELQTPELSAGSTGTLVLYWQSLASFPAPDFNVHVGVRRADGEVFGQADNMPVGGMLPVSRWQPGRVIRDAQPVPILPGTPAGQYTLEISLYSPALRQELPVRAAEGPRGTHAALAGIRVARPAPGAARPAGLGVAHLLPAATTPQLGASRLAGYDWNPGSALRAGDAVPLALLWQAGGPHATATQLFLQLSDGKQQWQRSQGHTLGGSYPAAGWQPGELVRDSWPALLPADAPSGHYRLRLVAVADGQTTVLLDLGSVDVTTRERNLTPPRPAFTQSAELGGVVRLLGYDVATTARPGEPLSLTLHWQALGEAPANYARFVHLLGPDDKIMAQVDNPPGGSAAPMTGWVSGEFIADHSELSLPADLPAGSYRLAAGLYDPLTGARLAGSDGADRIVLAQPVQVGRSSP